jgi:hypothetical protein
MGENIYQWNEYCKKKDCTYYCPDVIARFRICDTCRMNENVKKMLSQYKNRYVSKNKQFGVI